MKTDAINYNVLIPKDLDTAVKRVAGIEGVSKSLFVRSTILYWMRKHYKGMIEDKDEWCDFQRD
jgi:hypothetical protein